MHARTHTHMINEMIERKYIFKNIKIHEGVLVHLNTKPENAKLYHRTV